MTAARRWGGFGFLLLLFGGLLAAKFPHLITQPRLYAEEGLFFLQNALLGGGPGAVFIHFQGYLNVLNGATALVAATWIQPEYWAFAHQTVAFMVQVAVVGYIALARLSFLPTLAHKSVFVAALALVPAAAEVTLTSTNMHFWAAMPVICMLFDDAAEHPTSRLWGDAAFIGIAGLIGPPVAVLFPAMLVKAMLSRAPVDRGRALTLFLVLVAHLVSMAAYRAYWGGGPDRAILDILMQAMLILPWELLVGSVALIAAGFEVADAVARAVSGLPSIWLYIGAAAFYGVLLVILAAIRRTRSLPHVVVALVAISGVVAGSLFSYPHDAVDALPVGDGGRYTLLVNLVLLSAVAGVFARVPPPRIALIAPVVFLGVLAFHAPRDRLGGPGPDWRLEVAAWRAGDRPCGLRIEPDGWRVGVGEGFRARLEGLVGVGKAPILERVAGWRAENGMLRRPALAPKMFDRLCQEG
ncbi:MAG: hypothetical protein HQ481_02145 [Alphaproteobacteria bacterium]|nr:hypothetical protein [Alphaproteobacteria bacterium]